MVQSIVSVLGLCSRSGRQVLRVQAFQQLAEVAGLRTLNRLTCTLDALAVPCSSQPPSLLQLQQLQQYSTASLQQAKQYASLAAAAHDSGSESEPDSVPSPAPELLTPAQYRRKFQMWVDAKDAPEPCQTFEQASLPPQLLKALLGHGFTAPSYIQAQAWPIAREGRDLVAIASTGSGKTAGFLIPAFLHIQEQLQLLKQHQQQQQGLPDMQQQQPQQRSGWRSKWNKPDSWGGGAAAQPCVALVMAPTRELAQQIQHEAQRLGAFFNIKNACLYGGAPRGPQGRALQRRPQLVIATPGRLLDFIASGELNVSKVSMLILDEADRMLDMGFEPQIREVLDYMPGGKFAEAPKPDDLPVPARQTLFFSATWPKEVQSIARQLCRNDPVRVFVGNVQEKLVANRDVTQLVAMLGGESDRLPALQDYLHEHLHGAELTSSSPSGTKRTTSSSSRGLQNPYAQEDEVNPQPRVVVFASTKRTCDKLAFDLGRSGIRAVAVHGDKSQRERDSAIAAFRLGQVPVLVATDVAARGLDIPGVTAVVNYDFPSDHEMYVHRIGRTGRAGRKGESLTLLTPEDAAATPVLVQIMQDAGQQVPPELEEVASRVRKPAQSRHRYGSSSRNGSTGAMGRGNQWSRGRGSSRSSYRRDSDTWGETSHRERSSSSSSSSRGDRGGWGERDRRASSAW